MNIVPIQPEYGQLANVLPHTHSWEQLSEEQRHVARMRERFINSVWRDMQQGIKVARSIELLLLRIKGAQVDSEFIKMAYELGRGDKPPSRATIFRWVERFVQHGVEGLADKHEGRQRKAYGWEARALHWYQLPSKLSMAAIADLLQEEGFESALESRVRHYLKSLPHDVCNKKRLGEKTYRDAHMPCKRRDTSVIDVGLIYQGDGHTIDAYLAHPITGKPWRPELTAWMDIGSRYISGWYISLSESSISTLYSLSHALITHDHVPAMLHIDNGSGFKSKMMNAESTGFYERFSMETMFSIPGNPKGKGQIERWFRTLRDGYDKTFESYCGHDMSQDVIRQLLIDVRRGHKQLPTLDQYMNGLARFIERYHNKEHSALDGKTPAQCWATLQRTPLVMPLEAIIRPRITRTVQRGGITLFNREYRHAELVRYNTQQLIIEYNLHDDAAVRVLRDDGRFICDAALTQRMPYVSTSRIEDMQQNRLKGQLKRLERHADEVRERARMNIDHEAYVASLDTCDVPLAMPHHTDSSLLDDINDVQPANEIKLDIFDTDF